MAFSTDCPFQRPTRADIDQFLTEFASDDDRQKFASGSAATLPNRRVKSVVWFRFVR
jgi:uncharacterized protein